MPLVECVPNFSEGRDPKVVEAIAQAVRAQGVRVLDVQSDPDHHRCVVTFVGEPRACVEAAFAGARVAVERIDLNQHKGEHPRVGAVDVVPFVPVSGVSMEDCVQLARQLGARLWEELRLPVYFYEAAATREDRRNLEAIRKGQYEALREEVRTRPERRPDLGGPALHPTAGAAVVGARGPLVAFNVNLATADLALADRIARLVRASSGGFPHVKAKGIRLAERGLVQVSMNLTDFRVTPVWKVFEAVRAEAARAGVEVAGSEIVGLLPLDALLDVAEHGLALEGFDAGAQVMERRVWGA
jgi:glutamate formiminotransferase